MPFICHQIKSPCTQDLSPYNFKKRHGLYALKNEEREKELKIVMKNKIKYVLKKGEKKEG